MNDNASRMFMVVGLILGVWVLTYWLYEPRTAPRVTRDVAMAPALAVAPQVTFDTRAPSDPGVTAGASKAPKEREGPPAIKVQAPEFREYVVQRGDNGWKQIAARPEVFNDPGMWQVVARANPLVSPDRLKAGKTVLKIPVDPENIQGKVVQVDANGRVIDAPPEPKEPDPGTRTYTVGPDDSLWNIAKKMYGKGAMWKTIYEANRDVIKDPDRPVPGTILKVPPSP